jgi:hypothetical protein
MALISWLNDHRPASVHAGRTSSNHAGCVALDLGEESAMALFAAAWSRLGSSAALPAPMNTEAVQAPLFRHRAPPGRRVQIAAMIGEPGELAAVAAFERLGLAQARPVAVSASWMSDLPLAGTPLLARHEPDAALARLIAGVTRLQDTHAVLFRLVPNDAWFGQMLRQAACRLGVPPPVVLEPFERAGLDTGIDFDSWFNANFARKRRKEFRRLKARLSEQGTLEAVSRIPDEIRLMNGTLRRYGLPQPAPGLSQFGDAAKVALHDGARLVTEPLRRSEALRRGLRGLIYGSGANYYYRGS